MYHTILSDIMNAILQNGGHFQSNTSISEPKRRRASNVDSMYRFCGAYIPEKVLPNVPHHSFRHCERHFTKWRPFPKYYGLSQKLRGAGRPMLTLCIGFVGRRFQKKYCQIHHAIISAILEAILKKAAFFKVIRVIFENMRQIIVTLVFIIFLEYYSDSILLRASHNGGHNLAGYCGNLFLIIHDITAVKSCRICKCPSRMRSTRPPL